MLENDKLEMRKSPNKLQPVTVDTKKTVKTDQKCHIYSVGGHQYLQPRSWQWFHFFTLILCYAPDLHTWIVQKPPKLISDIRRRPLSTKRQTLSIVVGIRHDYSICFQSDPIILRTSRSSATAPSSPFFKVLTFWLYFDVSCISHLRLPSKVTFNSLAVIALLFFHLGFQKLLSQINLCVCLWLKLTKIGGNNRSVGKQPLTLFGIPQDTLLWGSHVKCK